MGPYRKYLITGAVVLVAVLMILFKYWDYVKNPWTRDGQVRAQIVQVAARVSGPIVNLPIRDNQFVSAGEVLFEIDPRTYEAAVEEARAELDSTGYDVEALTKQVDVARASIAVSAAAVVEAEVAILEFDFQIANNKFELERQEQMLPEKATTVAAFQQARATYEVSVEQKKGAEAGLAQAEASLGEAEANLAETRANLGALGEQNARIRSAQAALRQAELNLEFTEVRAKVDGYVTNLNLQLGTQAVANQPALALLDVNSFWIHGFFRETRIAHIEPGDRAIVTLMAYPDTPLEGRVESLGWGIAQSDGSPGWDLLPTISPTFEWIRLAQRVPVRVHLEDVPEEILLRAGITCSVLVMKGTADGSGDANARAVPPTPKVLQ